VNYFYHTERIKHKLGWQRLQSLREFLPFRGYHVSIRMAEEDGRKNKRSQNTQNIPGTRNFKRHGIEDVCFKADYSMKTKKFADSKIYLYFQRS